jgi:hypothetical protein
METSYLFHRRLLIAAAPGIAAVGAGVGRFSRGEVRGTARRLIAATSWRIVR